MLDGLAAQAQAHELSDLEDVERRLAALEARLFAAATLTLSADQLVSIRRELDAQLKPYRRKMTAEQLPGVLRRGVGRRRGHGIRRGIGERDSVPQEAFDDALSLGLDRGVALDRQQFCAGVENPLDAVASLEQGYLQRKSLEALGLSRLSLFYLG